MAGTDDDRFRIRPGKIRSRGDAGAKRFTSQVLRATQNAGSGPRSRLARPRGRTLAQGRGHVAARMIGSRLGPRTRRVVVKARLIVHAQAAAGTTAAHLRYIQRDSVTREGEPGRAYSESQDVIETDDFEARVRDDRHEFRFIISPEDAAEIDDLRGFTRDLMRRMEADLGTRLDWVGVDHWDTDNPHSHVVLRGVDETGRDLVIARDYIAHGFRLRACELATELLGPQTEREIRERMGREVDQERWTGLDRQLSERVREGVIDLGREPVAADGSFQHGLLVGRLRTLERLGLAEAKEPGRWSLSSATEPTLRAMGERGDIIRTMQRAMRGAERPLAIFDAADAAATPVIGRIADKGLADELQDRGYLVVDGLDGRAHYVPLPPAADLANFPVGGVVEVRGAPGGPRPADRTIAAQAGSEGIYRTDRHIVEVQRNARVGDDPEGFVAAHVRRLEALRRAGIVERVEDGVWRIPADFLDRATAFETERAGGAAVELRSHLDIQTQARTIGATWLDRALIDDVSPAPTGFGAEVREVLDKRRSVLTNEGLASRRGQRLILARDLLATLQAREVDQFGARLAAETGLEHRPVPEGGSIRGVYRRSVMLASGRFAMLDDGMGFSLVPWKPVLEQRLGQSVSGIARGGTVSWDLSRHRGIGI